MKILIIFVLLTKQKRHFLAKYWLRCEENEKKKKKIWSKICFIRLDSLLINEI